MRKALERQRGQHCGVVRWFQSLLGHGLVHNVLSLYAVQAANYIVPLVTVPYLARVLGASGWGLVAFAQAFGSYIALVGEYGFALSATREVARHRGDREKVTEILAGVLGAKLLLGSASLGVALLALRLVPLFRQHHLVLWSGMFWALGQAFNMMWFFLGIERMRLVALIDIAGKSLATIAIFLFVRRPGDEWRVLVLQGAGFFFSFLVCSWLAYREFPFRLPTWRSTWEALRMGWTMFLFRSSVSLYTLGNAFILGLFVPPSLVGYYAGAEKISKAFLGLLNPVSQSLYPRLSHLVHQARDRAARLAHLGLVVMGSGGVVMGVLVYFFAPVWVRLILGSGYDPAVPVLRWLALLPPLIALSNVLGIQWMLPLGLDRAFNTIIVFGGAMNILLAVILAPRFGAIGMAWAVCVAETVVTAGMYFVSRSKNLGQITRPVLPPGKMSV